MLLYAKKQYGIALIVVLILMQLIALLSWYTFAEVLLHVKSIKNITSRQLILQNALQALQKIENQINMQLPECIIPTIETKTLLSKSLDWWQSFLTCAGNFQEFQYYYVIESLGNDSCAAVEYEKKVASYYRISLFFTVENTRLWLQSTMIKPIDLQEPCQGLQHNVMTGRQSWRELNQEGIDDE